MANNNSESFEYDRKFSHGNSVFLDTANISAITTRLALGVCRHRVAIGKRRADANEQLLEILPKLLRLQDAPARG